MLLKDRFKDKNIYILSHNDLDGIGAIVLYKYYIEPIAHKSYFFSGDYDEISKLDFSIFDNIDIVLITDITPTPELYNHLIERGKEILVFDHHISAHDTLVNVIGPDDYFYSTEKCGTKIFFEWLTNNGRRLSKCIFQFVEYVNTYDTWQEHSSLWKEGKALHNILWGCVNWNAIDGIDRHSKFIETQLNKFHKGKNFYFTAYENRLALKAEEREREFLTTAKNNLDVRKDGEGNTYGYFELPSKLSIIANRLLKEFNNLDYIIAHATFGDKKGSFEPSLSLRSAGEVDVSVIATLHGGGGHKGSAGVLLEDYEFFLDVRTGKRHLI